jgi:hypothetical protein
MIFAYSCFLPCMTLSIIENHGHTDRSLTPALNGIGPVRVCGEQGSGLPGNQSAPVMRLQQAQIPACVPLLEGIRTGLTEAGSRKLGADPEIRSPAAEAT